MRGGACSGGCLCGIAGVVHPRPHTGRHHHKNHRHRFQRNSADKVKKNMAVFKSAVLFVRTSELIFGSELRLVLWLEVFVGAAVGVEYAGCGVAHDGVLGLVRALEHALQ